jgi:hypothetical protein
MRRAPAALALAALLALAGAAPASAAAPAPVWMLSMSTQPSNFAPGGTPEYVLLATNIGAAPTSGTSTLEVTLPKAWNIVAFGAENKTPGQANNPTCVAATPTFTCKTDEPIAPGRVIRAQVRVEVPAGEAEATLQGKALAKGGGASAVEVTTPTPVQAQPVPLGILPGLVAPLTDEGGAAATLAGSHPFQQTISFAFPTKNPGSGVTNDGHPRNFSVELPRGLLGSPAATPLLCTEAQLTGKGCPNESQVGVISVISIVGEVGNPDVFNSPLYNMVAPPGSAAELATDVAGIGIFPHILAGVRSDGDYGIEASTRDALAFGQQPIFTVQAQVWGTPSAPAHDGVRGECVTAPAVCSLSTRSEKPFLTLPTDCPGEALPFAVRGDSWEEPSPPFAPYETSYASADLAGNPVSVQDCGELSFEPTIQAHPTTNVTDSPSGLDFDLHQPSTETAARIPTELRDATIRFPAGLTVNASQASGLDACSQAQIGFREKDEAGALHFSKAPQSCPAAAKLGTVEATSPLLVARNAAHEVEEDPEGGPVLEVLHGSVYLAAPFDNPFGSLVAVYLAVEDERTGIVAKLAGEAELDPQSGQLTTRFEENPELPLQDVRVHLFGGSRGALITPPTCAAYTTKAQLTPWSAPEGKDAFPADSFQTTAAPGGGPCPSSAAQLPNAPKLSAGTESPTAGKYSPLIFKLSREDGSQRLAKIEATLPTGLLAKLAGVGECPGAGIAQAHSRERPRAGALEQASPSCPGASQIGTLSAAVGAGPTPYRTSGKVYLAGPYKGAPLSIVAIAPAVAGPFDLGTVVSQSALYLDPETGQGRIVSDPLPQILQGVPIDLRSVAVRADRPNFTLNPTSCDQKAFAGDAVSALGQPAPLFQRFQVGGCKSLPYKPRLSVRLFGPTNRGAHPRLRAVFTAKPGEANTAAISFAFPKSEFIDQAHFRTICTRVQFAANQCPAGSVYGHVIAYTPLLDYPLKGAAYLRSSTHKLPDLVFALRGPPSQPIAFDAAGRVDSVNGGLRVRFQTLPDAPLSKVIVTAQGAKKGLFQNSTNICKGIHRATLKLDAQNGKVSDSQPKLVAQCGGKSQKGKKHR